MAALHVLCMYTSAVSFMFSTWNVNSTDSVVRTANVTTPLLLNGCLPVQSRTAAGSRAKLYRISSAISQTEVPYIVATNTDNKTNNVVIPFLWMLWNLTHWC